MQKTSKHFCSSSTLTDTINKKTPSDSSEFISSQQNYKILYGGSNDNTFLYTSNVFNMLTYEFDIEFFLSTIYNCKSFDDVIKWTYENEQYVNPKTIKRVHNCAWRFYGKKKDNITTVVLDYYYKLTIELWMNDYIEIIYNKYAFNMYIDSDILNISYLDNDKKPDSSIKRDNAESIENLQKIIKLNFMRYDFFISIINIYLDKYTGMMGDISSHYKKIKNFIYKQLVKSIENKMTK